MAEESGTVYIGSGPRPDQVSWLAAIDHDQINNARGSNATYVNGEGLSDDTSEYAWRVPFKYPNLKAHTGPGELIYFGLKADNSDALVSSSETVNVEERRITVQGGQVVGLPSSEIYSEGDKNTTVADGGVAADPNVVPGQIIPTRAIRDPLKPNEYGRLTGFIRYVTADA